MTTFKFIEFNARRAERGADAARVEVDYGDGNTEWLWMSRRDIAKNMMAFGRSDELQKAHDAYGMPAHSKSEYRRRVAQGDPNVLPPTAGVMAVQEAERAARLRLQEALREAWTRERVSVTTADLARLLYPPYPDGVQGLKTSAVVSQNTANVEGNANEGVSAPPDLDKARALIERLDGYLNSPEQIELRDGLIAALGVGVLQHQPFPPKDADASTHPDKLASGNQGNDEGGRG